MFNNLNVECAGKMAPFDFVLDLYFMLWTASDCFVQSRNAAFIWNA